MHATAIRQSLALYTGSPDTQLFLYPDYDVVERVLRYRLSEPLQPNVVYTVELVRRNAKNPFGFRAFDGADLEEGAVPLKFSFFTSTELGPSEPRCEPSCSDVVDRLTAAGCARQGCHTARATGSDCPDGQARDHNGDCVGVPRMGLVLDSRSGLLATAIDRVAHQTETGTTGGIPLVNPSRMGVQMPIIDGGRPGNSYLLYKLLLRPANFNAPPELELGPEERARRAACTPSYRSVLPEGESVVASDAERTRLREWFVRGDGMPLVSRNGDPNTSPVTLDTMHELQAWIARGARCP